MVVSRARTIDCRHDTGGQATVFPPHLAQPRRQHAARQVPQADMASVRAQRQQPQAALGPRDHLVRVLLGKKRVMGRFE